MGKEPIHKEFIQEKVTVDNLLNAYKTIDINEFLKNAQALRKYLKNGSSKNVANIINS